MSHEEIEEFLVSNNLLDIPADEFGQRYWPGDKEENN